MPQIHIHVDDAIISGINRNLRAINLDERNLSAVDIAREALAVYKWVVERTAQGYAVVSCDAELKSLIQIATPSLPARDPTI